MTVIHNMRQKLSGNIFDERMEQGDDELAAQYDENLCV